MSSTTTTSKDKRQTTLFLSNQTIWDMKMLALKKHTTLSDLTQRAFVEFIQGEREPK